MEYAKYTGPHITVYANLTQKMPLIPCNGKLPLNILCFAPQIRLESSISSLSLQRQCTSEPLRKFLIKHHLVRHRKYAIKSHSNLSQTIVRNTKPQYHAQAVWTRVFQRKIYIDRQIQIQIDASSTILQMGNFSPYLYSTTLPP